MTAESDMDINTLDSLFTCLDDASRSTPTSMLDESHAVPPVSNAVLPLSTTPTTTHKLSRKRRASISSSEESIRPLRPVKSAPSTPKPTSRRQISSSSSSSNDSDSHEGRANTTRLRRRHHLGAKPNSSWAHQKSMKAHAKLASFKPNNTRLAEFQRKIKNDDPHVEFDQQDIRRVRCSNCAVWIVMRQLYDLRRWKDHRRSARCQVQQHRGSINQSIHAFFTKGSIVSALSNLPPVADKVPCPGLRREAYSTVAGYIKRTLALGGAPNRPTIAKSIFSQDISYAELSEDDKKQVIQRESHLYLWRIVRAAGSVYSTECKAMVPAAKTGGCPHACGKCLDLFNSRSFKTALRRKEVPEDRMKYTPLAWRDPEVGDIYLKIKGVRELVEQVGWKCFDHISTLAHLLYL